MLNVENSMVCGQSYSEWLRSNGGDYESTECYACKGTGKEVLPCECGYEPQYGDKLCAKCGRIVEYEKCYRCDGEGRI